MCRSEIIGSEGCARRLSGCSCHILPPHKLLGVARAQAAALGAGEDGQDAPVHTPAQSVGLEVVEQLRHDLRGRTQSGSRLGRGAANNVKLRASTALASHHRLRDQEPVGAGFPLFYPKEHMSPVTV